MHRLYIHVINLPVIVFIQILYGHVVSAYEFGKPPPVGAEPLGLTPFDLWRQRGVQVARDHVSGRERQRGDGHVVRCRVRGSVSTLSHQHYRQLLKPIYQENSKTVYEQLVNWYSLKFHCLCYHCLCSWHTAGRSIVSVSGWENAHALRSALSLHSATIDVLFPTKHTDWYKNLRVSYFKIINIMKTSSANSPLRKSFSMSQSVFFCEDTSWIVLDYIRLRLIGYIAVI